MSRHLKTTVFSDLTSTIFSAVPSPVVVTRHARGVRYLTPINGIDFYCGIMNPIEKGRKYRKHIIVRRSPRFKGLHQLYTYHFPTHWSAACVANRELIKLAQRYAHALEHDYSYAGVEWRIRFFKHYFNVFRLHKAPEPGLKAYSRFYQYAYVCIYRELKAEQQAAKEQKSTSLTAQNNNSASLSDISFFPINLDPSRHYTPAFRHRTANDSAHKWLRQFTVPSDA